MALFGHDGDDRCTLMAGERTHSSPIASGGCHRLKAASVGGLFHFGRRDDRPVGTLLWSIEPLSDLVFMDIISDDDSRFSRTDAYCAGTDFIQKRKLLFRSVAVLGPQSFQQIFVARRVSLPFELRREAFANRDNESPGWLSASGQFSQVWIFGSSSQSPN